ncbi:MAG: hypothetical protein HPY71_08565 [Firmicutes bacterium]|nr:hypothetical protein [Bacillota bacterium]
MKPDAPPLWGRSHGFPLYIFHSLANPILLGRDPFLPGLILLGNSKKPYRRHPPALLPAPCQAPG